MLLHRLVVFLQVLRVLFQRPLPLALLLVRVFFLFEVKVVVLKVGFDFEVDEVGCLILEVGDKDSTTEAGL